jgi:hypothetical protein
LQFLRCLGNFMVTPGAAGVQGAGAQYEGRRAKAHGGQRTGFCNFFSGEAFVYKTRHFGTKLPGRQQWAVGGSAWHGLLYGKRCSAWEPEFSFFTFPGFSVIRRVATHRIAAKGVSTGRGKRELARAWLRVILYTISGPLVKAKRVQDSRFKVSGWRPQETGRGGDVETGRHGDRETSAR